MAKKPVYIPRDYQRDALNAAINYFIKGGRGNPLVVAPTGAGKSIIIAELCRKIRELWAKKKILVVSHNAEILSQNYGKLVEQMPGTRIGLYAAGLTSKTIGNVTVASIQTIYNKPELFDDFNLIIVDECFTAGTKIKTRTGVKNIEDIKIGDEVKNATGFGYVESIFKKKTKEILTLKLSNGVKIECTKKHKFFTESGWVEASSMEGKRVINHETMSFLQDGVWPEDVSNWAAKRKSIQKTRMLLEILREEIKEPYGKPFDERKTIENPKKNRTQAKDQRGEWNWREYNGEHGSQKTGSWVDPGACHSNKNEAFKDWIPNLLQNRHCKPCTNDCNRVRWGNSLWGSKNSGREKTKFPPVVRVESISRKKQEGSTIVYDLQVSKHPSYYANGCLVHNCHTIPHSKTGRWHTFFETVKAPVIGFTATPYRLGAGYLHEGDGALFDRIVFTIKISTLQKQGHLSLVTSKGSVDNNMETKGIKKQGGDFQGKALSDEFDRKGVTVAIVDELIQYRETRKKWLLFAIDIDHCENIAEELNGRGIKTGVVHSKMKTPRKGVIDKFKDPFGYQCLVSVAVLTTGFDVPEVDLVGLLRPTQSPTLHVQIIGRGLRPHKGKKDCLVKDFAGNLVRLGPIDNPVVKVKGKGGGEPIMKMCGNCGELCHAAVRICPDCGNKFVFKHHLYDTSKEANVMLEPCQSLWYNVEQVLYDVQYKADGTGMVMVRYDCGMKQYKEPVCVEHTGYAKHKANHWWSIRAGVKSPATVAAAMETIEELKQPTRIFVNDSGKYPTIEEYDFE